MPLPSQSIVSAFFESYITIRKEKWGLDINFNEDGEVHISDSAKPVHKLDVCVKCIQKFREASTLDEWLKVISDLYDIEQQELKEHNDRSKLVKLFVNSPFILEVLRAARTYIISEVSNESKFIAIKDELSSEKKRLEQEIYWQENKGVANKDIQANKDTLAGVEYKLKSIDDSQKEYITFFENRILLQDPIAKKLDEKKFTDFMKNVKNKSRPLTLCDRVIEYDKKQKAAGKVTGTEVEAKPTVEQNVVAIPVSRPVEDRPTALIANSVVGSRRTTRRKTYLDDDDSWEKKRTTTYRR